VRDFTALTAGQRDLGEESVESGTKGGENGHQQKKSANSAETGAEGK